VYPPQHLMYGLCSSDRLADYFQYQTNYDQPGSTSGTSSAHSAISSPSTAATPNSVANSDMTITHTTTASCGTTANGDHHPMTSSNPTYSTGIPDTFTHAMKDASSEPHQTKPQRWVPLPSSQDSGICFLCLAYGSRVWFTSDIWQYIWKAAEPMQLNPCSSGSLDRCWATMTYS